MGPIGPLFRMDFPWRPPDLRRFARTAQFRGLRSDAAAWIGQQFALLQTGAAWLDPAGSLVSDYGIVCGTSCLLARDLGGVLRFRFGVCAQVRCQRQVAVAYGFDGALDERIAGLMQVLEQAGWEQPSPQTRPHMTGPAPVRPVPGRTGAAITSWGTPRGEHHGGPPQLVVDRRNVAGGAPCRVHVVWTTRARPADITLDAVWPPPRAARERTASYQPLEFSGPLLPAGIGEFAAPALREHEHAVAVMIELGYYVNRETATRPHRLPKRLMPRLW